MGPFPRSLALLVVSAVACIGPSMAPRVAHAEDPLLPGQPNQAAVDAFERGERLLAAGRHDLAVEAFDRAAELAPTFHLAHYAAGNALAATGKAREAEKRYRDCVAVAPRFAAGWNALGVVRMTSDRLEDALEAFDRALKLDADYLLARRHRAEALVRAGRPADAERDLRVVLAKAPDDADASVILARAQAGQGRIEQGVETLEGVLATRPDHGAARLALCALQAAQDELPAALVSLETAIARAGDDQIVRSQAARIAAVIADKAQARGELASQVKALDLLSTLAPRAPGVWARLGAALVARWEARDPATRDPAEIERARKALERCLELDPDQDAVRKLLEHYRDV